MIIRMICHKTCFYAGRQYEIGETAPIPEGEALHPCFHLPDHPYIPVEHRLSPGGKVPRVDGLPVLLLGDGPSLCAYLEQSNDFQHMKIAAVNRAGVKWPGKVDYWMTLHPDEFCTWRDARQANGYGIDGIQYITTQTVYEPLVIRVPFRWSLFKGSSALFALDTLLRMGAKQITIIGVDLTDQYYVFRNSWKKFYANNRRRIRDCDISAPGGFIKELFDHGN